ncbi:hypothetical protein BV898_02575 [Hypsibius exemplaris]|uniref:LysM domain-containing protein n=1 Tax=Hypsibius exemplaris TaxID=2072580 RepID=A0A1W0X7H8_HYPEX|nr:hypothetical protein BV898_02575 [Hypsibius exemplaris]
MVSYTPTIVISVVCLAVLLGTVFLFYPRDSAPSRTSHRSSASIREPEDVALVPAAAAVPADAPAAAAQNILGESLDDEEKCYAGVNEGDHCEAFVSGYGITSVARLMEMNPGLKCPGAGALMTVGHNIVIRKGQGCGTDCTPKLC